MAYQYKIREITFSEGTCLPLPNLTVLVGPNNAGKSRALKDIVDLTCSDTAEPVVVRQAVPQLPKRIDDLDKDYGISPTVEKGKSSFHWLRPTLDQYDGSGLGAVNWPAG